MLRLTIDQFRFVLNVLCTIEKQPRFITFAKSYLGKFIFILIFGFAFTQLGFVFGYTEVKPYSIILTVVALFLCANAGKHRHTVMLVLTFMVSIAYPAWYGLDAPRIAAAKEGLENQINFIWLDYTARLVFLIFAVAMIYAVRYLQSVPIFRRPILSLILFYFFLVGIAVQRLVHGTALVSLWSFINVLGAYFWFLGYALLNQKTPNPAPLSLQFASFHSIWNPQEVVPYGKGASNLQKAEANTPDELAVSQIKGLKLIICCLLLSLFLEGMSLVVHYGLGVPVFADELKMRSLGQAHFISTCWISLFVDFIETVIRTLIACNIPVACARMAGFLILRGSYRPLESKTIAEFWNRYHFYFRELLVEFFFYPVFIRCFRNYSRLRIAFAVFMAAGVGNILLHFMVKIYYVAQVGFMNAVIGFETYAVYAVVLVAGIVVSQLSPRREASGGWVRRNCLPFFKVVLFFSLLQVFDDTKLSYSLKDHVALFLYLFGLKGA